MHEHGLAKTAVNSLRKKYPKENWLTELLWNVNRVDLVDLFTLLEEQRNPNLINKRSYGGRWALMEHLREKINIKDLCTSADKIMLGAHGHYDDRDSGYAGLGWEQGSGLIGTYKEFAKLVSTFLQPNRTYKIALIVCFAARSLDYKKNHEGKLAEDDIKSSFAYKFFAELVKLSSATIQVTARTGAVSFDSDSGKSLVQTEAAVAADIADADLQKADETKWIADAYNKLQGDMAEAKKIDNFFAIEEAMLKPDAKPVSKEEQIIFAYNALKKRITELAVLKSKSVSKYGKFVYLSSGDKAKVYRKYGGDKKVELLWEGTL